MAGDPFRKVQRGQPLSIPAPAWNAMLDAAKKSQEAQAERKERTPAPASDNTILVKNGTGDALTDAYNIVKLSGTPMAYASDGVYRPIVITGVALDATEGHQLAIIPPCAEDALVRGVIAGPAMALIKVTDASHRFAVPSASGNYFESAEGGWVAILYSQGVDATPKLGVVNLSRHAPQVSAGSLVLDPLLPALEFRNDQAVPPPMHFYGTNQYGVKGYWPICDMIAFCSGEDPEEGRPCGPCAADDCYEIAGFTPDMFTITGCYAAGILGLAGTLWDGKLHQTSSAGQPCAYAGVVYLTDPEDGAPYLANYTMVQFMDGEVCTWRYTLLAGGFDVPAVIWQGTHTGTDPDSAALTRVAGCDSTATITLQSCYLVECGTLDEDGYQIAGYSAGSFGCGSCSADATIETDWDGSWRYTTGSCGFWATAANAENIYKIGTTSIYGSAIYLETNYDGAGNNRWVCYATCGGAGSIGMWAYCKYEGDTPAGVYNANDWNGHNPGWADPNCGGPSSITVEAIP